MGTGCPPRTCKKTQTKERKRKMNIVKQAVEATNESNQKQVVVQAQRLIALIQGEQSAIRSSNERITGFQKEVRAISEGSITLASVMGETELPNDGNPNTATIIKAIEEANKSAQDSVRIASANLVGRITGEQNNIKACEDRIAKYRDELDRLGAASVTVESVMD
jgi:hypothetical protein